MKSLLTCLFIAVALSGFGIDSPVLKISTPVNVELFHPLDKVVVTSQKPGEITLLDGKGNEYFKSEIDQSLAFFVGGALGTQEMLLLDKKGKLVDRLAFKVEARTQINDGAGTYNKMLDMLYYSMTREWGREAMIRRFQGRDYHLFVGWLRDHVHTLKGMKYFYPEVKSGIDLYANSQREDGMIWDNYTHPQGSYWVQRFRYGNFVKEFPGDRYLFTRIPVENDVEYLFIEGIYYTWKASGDTEWMKSRLDNALKAVQYATTSPYRWSEKYQLLKRGHTIDTWDFQDDEDAAISVGPDELPDPMIIKPEYTQFGIMFGDNTGMIASLRYLTEMLNVAGRAAEAEKMLKISATLESRLNKLSWNGNFYTHHVLENPAFQKDLGVDERTQVSLSNAYSLNRGIGHDKAVQIIKTYQDIKRKMPQSSPGEFYTIYPPFEKGYGSHNSKWNYMNGGVTSIVAGELAHGAFENGYEKYGVDILKRQYALAQKTDNYLHCTYRGKMPEEPERKFIPLSLVNVANTDFVGITENGVMGWTNEGENDLHEMPVGKRKFQGIDFKIIDPAENNRKACLGLSLESGYAQQATVAVGQKAKSIYFLHTASNTTYAGSVTAIYADGSTTVNYITPDKITAWWYPSAPQNRKQMPNLQVAWVGKNTLSDQVGVGVYGWNNPYPEKEIKKLVFDAAQNHGKWMVLGITLSDYPVLFMPDIVSDGIPDNWGAAAVTYALVEGLAGVKDEGLAFDKVNLAPRWAAAGENKADVTIKYEASGAYLSYRYLASEDAISLTYTGVQQNIDLQVLLPEGKKVVEAFVNNEPADFENLKVEDSSYGKLLISGNGVNTVTLEME